MLSSQHKSQGWGKQGKAGKHTLLTKTHTHSQTIECIGEITLPHSHFHGVQMGNFFNRSGQFSRPDDKKSMIKKGRDGIPHPSFHFS